ncbi:MAG: Ig domain-containing protein [Ruminococcus sp.]|nr:Ig domain-containing protein [Ruminococcus sp.]
MKHRILPFLLAVILGAAALTACHSGSVESGDEAVNRVYPEGEGHFYDGSQAGSTASTDPSGTVAGSTAATKPTVKPTVKTTTPATTAATKPTAVNPAATSPQPTIANNVPADNVTGSNINPNIGSIQEEMSRLLDAYSVKSISLSETTLSLEAGESQSLTISYEPADATNKISTASANNSNVSVAVSGATVTITGVKAGTATVTVTSANGHKATCDVTVKRTEQSVSDDAVLPHDSLVNVDNAQRWIDELSDYLEDLGMSHNANLQGESFRLTTVGLNNLSYNSASNQFKEQAEAEAASLTNGDWEDYEFNYMLRSVDNGEYAIVVAVNRIPYNQ